MPIILYFGIEKFSDSNLSSIFLLSIFEIIRIEKYFIKKLQLLDKGSDPIVGYDSNYLLFRLILEN